MKNSQPTEAPSHELVASRRSETRSMLCWLGFILMFFALQALLWTTAISLARKHPVRPAITSSQPKALPTAGELENQEPNRGSE